MKLAILLVCLAGGVCILPPNSEIDFQNGDLHLARDQAIMDGKWVFVEVYASWCIACRLMDETTFRSPLVAEVMSSHFIPVRLDIDDIEGKIFAAEHNVSILPALLVIDGKGKKISQVNEALSTNEMVSVLDQCAEKKAQLATER
ncbi:MAG: thioredoxin family protein [Saprospiraceae bacterium]|nr:thioredoxin family protein [Saprospiraceae bacterium]